MTVFLCQLRGLHHKVTAGPRSFEREPQQENRPSPWETPCWNPRNFPLFSESAKRMDFCWMLPLSISGNPWIHLTSSWHSWHWPVELPYDLMNSFTSNVFFLSGFTCPSETQQLEENSDAKELLAWAEFVQIALDQRDEFANKRRVSGNVAEVWAPKNAGSCQHSTWPNQAKRPMGYKIKVLSRFRHYLLGFPLVHHLDHTVLPKLFKLSRTALHGPWNA